MKLFMSTCTIRMYRVFITLFIFLTLIVNLGKPETGRISPRIVILSKQSIAPYAEVLQGFENICKTESRKYYIDTYSNGRITLLQEIKEIDPRLILAIGPDTLSLIKDRVKGIPIVFVMVLNPANLLNGEYDNISGVSMNIPAELQIRTLLKFAPGTKKIGVVYDPNKTGFLAEEGELAAYRLGVKLVMAKVGSRKEVFTAWEELLNNKIEAVWMVPDTTVVTETVFKYLLLFSFRQRIPLIGISGKQVKDGALFAFSFDIFGMGEQAAEIANLVLAGRQINTIPYEYPNKYKLVINSTTAELLGVGIPKDIKGEVDLLEK